MKVIDPVGTLLPEADAETFAVNVTLWPKVVGLVEAVRMTEVPPTRTMLGAEVLPRKSLPSPP